MAQGIARGDIWMFEFKAPDKRRPVLVISRPDAIAVLRTVIVAPITSTIYGIPSEVVLGIAHGLKGPSAANFDHVQVVDRARLRKYVGRAGLDEMRLACAALAIATGCS